MKIPNPIIYKMTQFSETPLPSWLQWKIMAVDMKLSDVKMDKDGRAYVVIQGNTKRYTGFYLAGIFVWIFRFIEQFFSLRPRRMFEITEVERGN